MIAESLLFGVAFLLVGSLSGQAFFYSGNQWKL